MLKQSATEIKTLHFRVITIADCDRFMLGNANGGEAVEEASVCSSTAMNFSRKADTPFPS